MSEWWTYGLSDFLMFSARTWYRLLELHNSAWTPLHAVTTFAAAWLLWVTHRATPRRLRIAFIGAGLVWLFVAWAFHWLRYAPINWAASYFAVAFGLQGLGLLWHGWAVRDLRAAPDGARQLGQLMLLGAMLYPLVAPASGRVLTQSEWVGLMPDPTVLGTLGMLLCVGRRWLMLVPLLWCAVTGATLWTLNSREWFLMPLAGTLALAMLLRGARGRPHPA